MTLISGLQFMAGTELYSKDRANSLWFFFTVLYIILDYSRIYQELQLDFLRPLMLNILILTFFLMSRGGYSLTKSKQTTLMWLFILLLASYIPFARNNYYAYKTTISQLLYMPFILSVIVCINTISRLKRFIFICILIEIYIASYAIFHAGRGPGNYFGDENDLALYLNMWLPFCYFLFFAHKNIISKIIGLVGFFVGLASVVVSFSRGGFVGLVAMGFVAFLFSKKKILTMGILTLVALTMFFSLDMSYWKEMETSTDITENTASERISSWQTAWTMFLDNPLGVGGHNFERWFPEYQEDRFKRNMWGRVAHSLWFTLIPELGIVGIYLYLYLLYTNLKDVFWLKSQIIIGQGNEKQLYFHSFGVACLISLSGFFASGTFLSVLYYAHYWYLTGLIVAAVNVAKVLTFKRIPEGSI